MVQIDGMDQSCAEQMGPQAIGKVAIEGVVFAVGGQYGQLLATTVLGHATMFFVRHDDVGVLFIDKLRFCVHGHSHGQHWLSS